MHDAPHGNNRVSETQMEVNQPALLRETEAAALLNLETATLRRWRWAGKGPKFRKIGGAVRYHPHDLTAFIDASTRRSTSEVGR